MRCVYANPTPRPLSGNANFDALGAFPDHTPPHAAAAAAASRGGARVAAPDHAPDHRRDNSLSLWMLPQDWIEHDDEDLDSNAGMVHHGMHHAGGYGNGDDAHDALHFGNASGTGSPDPPKGNCALDEEANEMRIAMRINPRYPALLEAYFDCRAVGADEITVAALEKQKSALLAAAEAARAGIIDNGGGSGGNSDNIGGVNVVNGNLLSRPSSPSADGGGIAMSHDLCDLHAYSYGADLDEFMTMVRRSAFGGGSIDPDPDIQKVF